MRVTFLSALCLVWCMLAPAANAGGALTDNIRIDSQALGYTIQFRVYIPEGTRKSDRLPIAFVTDGQWFIRDGKMVDVLDDQISQGLLKPLVVVFVDSGNPDNPKDNRRNDEFMCNGQYGLFYQGELIPTVEANFPVSQERTDRLIMGMSFGGLNAACFGLMIPDMFGNIGMLSPANDQHLKLLKSLYSDREKLPLKMFFSVGTKRDNTKAARKFQRVLDRKGYDLTYIEVPFGHEWANWRPLLDDLLLTFFANN